MEASRPQSLQLPSGFSFVFVFVLDLSIRSCLAFPANHVLVACP